MTAAGDELVLRHSRRLVTRRQIARRLTMAGATDALYALAGLSGDELDILVRLEQEGGPPCRT